MNIQAQPWFGSQSQQLQSERLPIAANAPFYLTHHPVGWELVVEGKKIHWLPELGKLHEIPGVNGVQSIKGGGADSAMAKARAQQNGKTVLPWSLGYLTKYPARGGDYFCIRWSSPKSIGNNFINKLDEKGWNEFRRQLIVDGYIKPMDEDLIPFKIKELETILNRLFKDQHLPEVKKRMVLLESKISNMKKATILKVAS